MCAGPSKLKLVQEIVLKAEQLCVDEEYLFVPGIEEIE